MLAFTAFDVSLLDDDLSSSESETEPEEPRRYTDETLSQCPTMEMLPNWQPIGPICRKNRVSLSVSLDGPLFEMETHLDGVSGSIFSASASSRRRRRRKRTTTSAGTNLSASCSSLPSSVSSALSNSASMTNSSGPSSPASASIAQSPSLSATSSIEHSFLSSSLEELFAEPLPVACRNLPGIRPSPLATSSPMLGASTICVNLGTAAAATAKAAASASAVVQQIDPGFATGMPQRSSFGTCSRPSRAERGRSGRRHRRDTGVSIRALRIVDAARLGPWPPAAFSKLCNCLKDAPSSLIDVTLSLRPARTHVAELLVQNSSLRGGGTSFKLDELSAEDLGGNFLLRAALSNMSAAGADQSVTRQIARLWV